MSEKAKINRITEGPIFTSMLLFFLPIMVGSFFQQLYNTVDAIVVGQYVGKEALAAVGGTTGTIINLFIGVFIGLSTGFSVVISQYMGSKSYKNVYECIHTAVGFAIISGTAIGILGAVFTPYFLSFMHVPPEMLDEAIIYLRIYFIGMIANMIYNMCAAILRGIGDSKRPLYFLIIACLTNIVLDALFVIYFKMGVTGVAIATVISQVLSALLMIINLTKVKAEYKLRFDKIHINNKELKKMLSIGTAAAVQSVAYTAANIYVQSNVNTLGIDVISGYTVYVKTDTIFWMTSQALGVSVTTFIGQNFGAGNRSRVKKTMIISGILSFCLCIMSALLFIFYGDFLMSLFTNDKDVVTKGMYILNVIVPAYIFYGIIEVYSSSLRGVGDTFVTTLLSLCGICLLRILWILFVFSKHHELFYIIIAYPLSWLVTAVLFTIYTHFFSRFRLWLRGDNITDLSWRWHKE